MNARNVGKSIAHMVDPSLNVEIVELEFVNTMVGSTDAKNAVLESVNMENIRGSATLALVTYVSIIA